MKTYNNFVATRPFVQKTIEIKVKTAFAMTSQKTSLQALEVVFECHDFPEVKTGDNIYVRSDMVAHAWAKEEFVDNDGLPYILVPRQFVYGYDNKGK